MAAPPCNPGLLPTVDTVPPLISTATNDLLNTQNSSSRLPDDDAKVPQRRFDCASCGNPGLTDDYRAMQTYLNHGDVYATKDSIYGVIMDIMRVVGQPIPDSAVLSNRSLQSRVSDGLKDSRPCVLLEAGTFTAPFLSVCLMATYRKSKDLKRLPPIFSHFNIPVHPNPALLHPFEDHIHSSPEWHRFDQWIFACEFRSTRVERYSRWKSAPMGRRRHYVFGKRAMEHLLLRCNLNSATWYEKCEADPEWALEQWRLVIEHLDIDRNRSGRSFGSDRSEGSRKTYPHPMNASRSLTEEAIPEHEVAAFSDLADNDENMPPSGAPSHRSDTQGGAYRAKSSSSTRRASGTSLTSADTGLSDVRVETPVQADTGSIRSTGPYRKGRKGSGGRRIFNSIMGRVLPSRKNSKE